MESLKYVFQQSYIQLQISIAKNQTSSTRFGKVRIGVARFSFNNRDLLIANSVLQIQNMIHSILLRFVNFENGIYEV